MSESTKSGGIVLYGEMSIHGGGPVVLEAPKKGRMYGLRSLRHTSTSLMNSCGVSSIF